MRKRAQFIAPALVLGVLLLGGFKFAARPSAHLAQAAPAPMAQVASITGVPAAVASSTPEPSPQPTDTAEPTATATSSATPAPTDTPTPTATATPKPTATPVPLPPDRIVAAAIGLDAKVVTVGWHEVVQADGSKHTEWDVASYAAGWHKNSARPGQGGNIVLSGHNNIEGEVFRNLEKFRVGDQITLYVGERIFDYIVTDTFTVPDKGVSYQERVKNARWIGPFPEERLTLVSCWPPTNNTHRIFIIAKPKG